MIHYIKGRITETTDTGVVIERNGIGYELTVPSLSAVYMTPPDQEVTVYTAMIVREDDVSLYGFDDRESLKLFRLLMTVSGIGAKAAVAVLSALSPAEVQKAVVFNDPDTLARAQGIGKKTAQRIVLELKDKLEDAALTMSDGGAAAAALPESDPMGSISEAVSALMSLGYSRSEASEAVASCGLTDAAAEEYIRAALKKLSRL